MKNKKLVELDVDFIGGDEPLTLEEKQKISDYINTQKYKDSLTHNNRRLNTNATTKQIQLVNPGI